MGKNNYINANANISDTVTGNSSITIAGSLPGALSTSTNEAVLGNNCTMVTGNKPKALPSNMQSITIEEFKGY